MCLVNISLKIVGTQSKWYVLDYFELKVLPLFINVSKYHIDFILEFFFDKKDEKETPETQKKSEEEPDYPTFFKHVRIDHTELEVSLYWSDSSIFVRFI
jgi:hypothetical protein